MRRFRFTLQALHTLRLRQERFALEQYAATLVERQQAVNRVAQVEHEITRTWSELRTLLAQGCDAASVLQFRGLCTALEESRQRVHAALAQAERQVQQAFARLIEARRQREAVDKVHDRQKSAYERDRVREEVKILDELALRRLPPELTWRTAT